jgi:hypothetical protein
MFGRPKTASAQSTGGVDELAIVGEFEAAATLETEVEASPELQTAMIHALERLRGQHLAFRRPEQLDQSELDELRLSILKEVTASPSLEDYYREAWGLDPARMAATGTASLHDVRRVAVMQIELLVRAFFILRLHLYANAPENHGWMTLFRTWSSSPRFRLIFDELALTLPREVVAFYRVYVEGRPSLASATQQLPIHHPWLTPADGKGRGLYMDSGRVEADLEVDVRSGSYGITDDAGIEGADKAQEVPSDRGADDGGEGPPNE